jgi:hypothetical protein
MKFAERARAAPPHKLRTTSIALDEPLPGLRAAIMNELAGWAL